MKTILVPLLTTLADLLRSRVSLHLEMLALRQQLAMVASRDNKRLRFRPNERIFWIWLYRLWPSCLQTLAIFKPDTLVRWHRKGFRLYWTWKSRRYRGGRPAIDPDVRELIRTMSRNNIGWGAPATARPASMVNCGCWVSVCPNPLSQNTWSVTGIHLPRPGVLSSIIMYRSWYR